MRPLQPLGLGTGVGGARSPGAPGRTQRCARGVPHPAGCVLPTPRPGGRAGARPLRVSPRLCCCSQDSGLPALISSLHRSHLVMPEPQSRCEFQRGSVELGLGAAGEERGVGTAAAQPEDSCPCSPRLCAAPCTPPPPAALAGGQEEAGGGGQLSPGAPCDGNCVNPGQPGRRGGGGGGSTVAVAGVGSERLRPPPPPPHGRRRQDGQGRVGLTGPETLTCA